MEKPSFGRGCFCVCFFSGLRFFTKTKETLAPQLKIRRRGSGGVLSTGSISLIKKWRGGVQTTGEEPNNGRGGDNALRAALKKAQDSNFPLQLLLLLMEKMQPGVSCCQSVRVCVPPHPPLWTNLTKKKKKTLLYFVQRKIAAPSAREADCGNFYSGEKRNTLDINGFVFFPSICFVT